MLGFRRRRMDGGVQLPVWGFRLLLVVALIILFVVFSAADDGYCTAAVKGEVRKGDGLGCFEYWLNRYQTLLGAVVALLGAGLAYAAVRGQIAQAERIEAARRQRDIDAARAVVPHALSRIGDYCAAVIDVLKVAREDSGRMGDRPHLELPGFPEDVIPMLQEAVRHSEDDFPARFADLIATSQVQRSRSKGFIRSFNDPRKLMVVPHECDGNIFDAADLNARAMELFDYARKYQDELLVDGKAILANTYALGMYGVSEDFLRRAHARDQAIALRSQERAGDGAVISIGDELV